VRARRLLLLLLLFVAAAVAAMQGCAVSLSYAA
jgi:hypothetical protein